MEIILSPYPHTLTASSKKLHGWWPGRRECTGERLLINPYNGCSVGCFFCYARSFPGNFQRWHTQGVVNVSKDFPAQVARQLDRLRVVSCGYLSPVSDPFQKVNERYGYSEKIVEIFVERNIPINVTTKCVIPEKVIKFLSLQQHSFAQVSILTLKENLRKVLSPGGTHTQNLLENFARLRMYKVFSVARIDPIIPYLTDNLKDIEKLVDRVVERGANHIIVSVLDVPVRIKDYVWEKIKVNFGKETLLKLMALYKERIGPYLHAEISYRREIFSALKEIVSSRGVTFALCMEFERVGERLRGLNREFMTSANCDGMDVPIYVRKNFRFSPAYSCKGNCLNCEEALCGIEELAMGKPGSRKDWKFSDYRRWSKMLE
ncbi:MAG: hypothetical protein GXO71_01730 [Caldiserica bacterium]|nr:hypothetical protein [Caldisericota bacterium]